MSLEKLAQGQRCYMAFPGICCGDQAKVVLCHVRRGGTGGMGIKPPSICALPGCFDCHNAYDGRYRTSYSRDELDAMVLVGLVQWLAWLWKGEYIIAVISQGVAARLLPPSTEDPRPLSTEVEMT